jgi:hypothetical protein
VSDLETSASSSPSPSAPATPHGLPFELIQSWFAALDLLDEDELDVVVRRCGLDQKPPRSFEVIGGELGARPADVEASYQLALERLAGDERTLRLAVHFATSAETTRTPAASSEEPVAVEGASAVTSGEHGAGGAHDASIELDTENEPAQAPEEDVDASTALAAVLSADGALEEALAECDEAMSPELVMVLRQARAAVAVARRELARTIEQEREALVADHAASSASSTPVPNPESREPKRAKERRGRKPDLVETARRRAVLDRVLAGELSNAEAAEELGLRPSAWSVWKSVYSRRVGLPTQRGAARSGVLEPAPPRSRALSTRKPESPETRRRVAVLERFQAGELTNAQAASELGLRRETWDAWKSYHIKRTGLAPFAPATPETPGAALASRSTTEVEAPTPPENHALERLAARLHRLESLYIELEKRAREQELRLERLLGRERVDQKGV